MGRLRGATPCALNALFHPSFRARFALLVQPGPSRTDLGSNAGHVKKNEEQPWSELWKKIAGFALVSFRR